MIKVHLWVFLIIYGGYLLSVKAIDEGKCFHFTWIASANNDIDNKPDNCSSFKGVPCVLPIISSPMLPNLTQVWESGENLCNITSSNVCIKYSFLYDNKAVNTTFFCGKATEDKVKPITSGCYEQQVDGYTVEMCACQSKKEKRPCNTSVKIKYSATLIITMLVLTFINLT